MQSDDVGVMNYIYYFTNGCDFMASKSFIFIFIFMPYFNQKNRKSIAQTNFTLILLFIYIIILVERLGEHCHI